MSREGFIVYRSTGGYWEPQEWMELRRFDDEEEAAAYVRDAGRRGVHMRYGPAYDPDPDPADLDPGQTPATPDTSYLEVRHPDGRHR